MDEPVTPSDHVLGRLMLQARSLADLSQGEAAKQCGYNQTRISRFENGQRAMSDDDIVVLLRSYETVASTLEAKARIAEINDQVAALRAAPPASVEAGGIAPHNLIQFHSLELSAVEVYGLYSERIPASLQHDQYLLLQYKLAGHHFEPHRLFAHRAFQQRVFRRADPPNYHVTLTESAVTRMPGGDMDMMIRDQAEYLLDIMARYSCLDIRILPLGAKIAYVDQDATVALFPGGEKPVLLRSPGGEAKLSRGGSETRRALLHLQDLHSKACTPTDTQKILYRLATGDANKLAGLDKLLSD